MPFKGHPGGPFQAGRGAGTPTPPALPDDPVDGTGWEWEYIR